MKIFELMNTYPNQKIPDPDQAMQSQGQNPGEDQQGKFDANQVDQNLQDIAQNVGDQNAQPDLPQGAEPEQPPELDDANIQPIDDALLSQIKSQPYVTKWNVTEKSPISPLKIAKMDTQELSSLRNLIRFKIQTTTLQDQVGLDDNSNMEYYNDLRQFVDTILRFKKTNTKAQLAKTNPTPSFQTMKGAK